MRAARVEREVVRAFVQDERDDAVERRRRRGIELHERDQSRAPPAWRWLLTGEPPRPPVDAEVLAGSFTTPGASPDRATRWTWRFEGPSEPEDED